MAVNSFNKINVKDKDIMAIQDNIDFVLKSILSNVILNSLVLKNVALTSGAANDVSHKLSQTLTGWLVIRNRANAVVWDNQDTNVNAKRTLILQTSADTVVDLLVF